MKYKAASPEFKPVEITITLETPGEVSAFYAIFNHNWFLDAARRAGLDFGEIRYLVDSAGYSGAFNAFEECLKRKAITR